jgi:stearoyl-CoA desaturase (Delta-9 desaturase)
MSIPMMFLITIGILQVSVLLTTIYLHRAMCHRGLEINPIVANLMHLQLSLFTGIVPRQWVAVHRKHHHFSDREGDPHSPYLLGLWHVFFGNFFYYKNEIRNEATIRKYTPDHKPDVIDRLPIFKHGYAAYLGLGIFMLMFGLLWGFAMWAFHGVAYILLNSSINSICHMIGYRNYDNLATNHQFIALLTGGEGLHNNHHEYPSSAKFALKAREIDPAWPVIWTLERLGLASVKEQPIARAA